MSTNRLDLLLRQWRAASWAEYEAILSATLEGPGGPSIPWSSLGLVPGLPLLNFGAGSGRDIFEIRHDLPHTEMVALEPDPLLRAVLTARVAQDSILLSKVTVARTFAELLPLGPFGGITLVNVLHLVPSNLRLMVGSEVARVATAGTCLVLSRDFGRLQGDPDSSVLVKRGHMGRYSLERWFRWVDQGDRFACVNTFRLLRGSSVVHEDVVEAHRYVHSLDAVVVDFAAAGFELELLDESFILMRVPGA